MSDRAERQDVYLPPGTLVRLDGSEEYGPEYGVVVHCWFEEEMDGFDCYVAFFGHQPPPSGKPAQIPYVLRYLSMSLVVLEPPEGAPATET